MDNLTPEQRSYCMSRVKGRDTTLERKVRSRLHKLGYRFRKHCSALPGKPDIVFHKYRVAVYIDGDFWHGYRFPAWQSSLNSYWKEKIAKNRERDKRNFSKMRNQGWIVIRLWEHEIKKDFEYSLNKIISKFHMIYTNNCT